MVFTARTETYTNVASLTTPFDTTVTKPTGTVDGDILFQFWAIQATTPPTVDTVPGGSWNLIATRLVSTNYRFYLYWKKASGEGANWTWSFTASAKVRGVCSCYTSGNFHPNYPINTYSDTQYIMADTILRAASMNVTYPNSPLLFFSAVYHTSDENLAAPSAPGTWVQDDEGWNTTADWAWVVASQIWAGSGATGNMDGSVSVADAQKHAFAVALYPLPTKALTAGAELQLSSTKTFTAGAELAVGASTYTLGFTVGSELQFAGTKSLTVGAELQLTSEEIGLTAGAQLQLSATKPFTAGAELLANKEVGFTVDAELQATPTSGFSCGAELQASSILGFTCNAELLADPSVGFTVNSELQLVNVLKTFTCNAELEGNVPASGGDSFYYYYRKKKSQIGYYEKLDLLKLLRKFLEQT